MKINVKVIIDGQEVTVERDLQNTLQQTVENYAKSKFVRTASAQPKKRKWKAKNPFRVWTPIEDGILLAKYIEMKDGYRKSAIIRSINAELPKRTEVAIYNRLGYLLKHKYPTIVEAQPVQEVV